VRDPLQTIQWWKDFASIAQSFGTVAIAAAGGWWAYWKFGISQNRYPHIETSADIQFIGVHGDYWIIELLAYIENKGTAQHRMKKFDFELSSLNRDDQLKDSKKFGGQVYFPNLIKKGSFLANYEYFVVDAGVKAKYSYITNEASPQTDELYAGGGGLIALATKGGLRSSRQGRCPGL
jgi:hypothetical protein